MTRSQTETAYATLRADLLACRHLPGRKLKILELCSRLGVGPSAVREALSRLSAEGFVVSEPQKGFRVAPVSIKDLEDLTRTRIEIESICLRRAIAAGGIEWETQLVASFHRLSRTRERVVGDEKRLSDAWAAAHDEYHLALVQACESVWLLRLRHVLFSQAERYIRLSIPLAERRRDVEAEHRAIMDAALARDADQACALLAEHFLLTATIVRGVAQETKNVALESEGDVRLAVGGRRG